MFEQNKYTKWYYVIIKNAKERRSLDTYERHHIIPRSLGGDNSSENIAKLSYREHYICHLLLTKMTIGAHRKKMLYALSAMKMKVLKNTKFNSHLFNRLKIEANKCRSASLKGRKISDQHRKKISLNHHNCSGENNSFFGKKHTPETKKKIGNRDYSNQSGALSPNSKPVVVNGENYTSLTEASRLLMISRSTLADIIKKRRRLGSTPTQAGTIEIFEAYYP